MRLLLVLNGDLGPDLLREKCLPLLAQGHELALCCINSETTDFSSPLRIQRRVTRALRQALNAQAEAIPIFVAATTDSVEEYARIWAATEVLT